MAPSARTRAASPKHRRSADILLKRVLRSRAYRGKHVILIHGKVYAAASAAEVSRLFDQAVKEFPGDTPTLAYVPEADTLILVLG